jgi:ribosomal protein S8
MKRFYLIAITAVACAVCLTNIGSVSKVLVQAQDSHIEHPAGEGLPIINQDSMTQLDNNEKVSFKIKGIDYSNIIAQILITIDDETYAETFDPISLLDPHDDGNGVIEFEMLIPKDAFKPGSTYTSCIRIIEDTDDYPASPACQTGSIDEIHTLSGDNRQIYLKM